MPGAAIISRPGVAAWLTERGCPVESVAWRRRRPECCGLMRVSGHTDTRTRNCPGSVALSVLAAGFASPSVALCPNGRRQG
jgi:hypothetical protein